MSNDKEMLKKINRWLIQKLSEKYPNWDVSIALRYLPIVTDIQSTFNLKSKVLDVGSGEFGLATYIPEGYDITGTDLTFGKEREKKLKIVKASAEKLPFAKNSFDVVVSVDMLEHLTPEIRERAVYEMLRVAKSKIYLSFPRGRLSTYIDRLIAVYYKKTHKAEFAYLTEHALYGLPTESAIERFIKSSSRKLGKKISINKRGNTNSILWLKLLLMGFSENKILTNIYHKLLLIIPILNLFHFWPTYRVSYFITLNKAK